MQKLNLAVGTLLLLGFLLIVVGFMSKLIEFNFLEPLFDNALSCFIAANTCFIVALAIDRFQ